MKCTEKTKGIIEASKATCVLGVAFGLIAGVSYKYGKMAGYRVLLPYLTK